MGRQFFRRPINAYQERITSTAQKIGPIGLSVLGITGSTADKTVLLSRPLSFGDVKTLVCASTGTQKVTATIDGSTLTGFFEGTTFRSIAFSSNSTKQRTAQLMAYSTGGAPKWGIVWKSTGVTLAG